MSLYSVVVHMKTTEMNSHSNFRTVKKLSVKFTELPSLIVSHLDLTKYTFKKKKLT